MYMYDIMNYLTYMSGNERLRRLEFEWRGGSLLSPGNGRRHRAANQPSTAIRACAAVGPSRYSVGKLSRGVERQYFRSCRSVG